MRAIPLILKATQRARAQRLASLGAGRVALCVIIIMMINMKMMIILMIIIIIIIVVVVPGAW